MCIIDSLKLMARYDKAFKIIDENFKILNVEVKIS